MARSDGVRARRHGVGARAHGGVGFAVVAALGACTELSPGNDTLAREAGFSRPDAAAADPRWSCLDEGPRESADRAVQTVDLALSVVDTVSGAIPEGLTARACSRRDVYCTTPLVPAVPPSPEGMAHLAVAQGFDGYVEVTSPTSVPTMFFVSRPLMRDTRVNFGIISTIAFNGLAMRANTPVDATRGHVLVYVFDCMGAPAQDVKLVNDLGGTPFVFVTGLPTLGRDVTSDEGIGGFVNVPVGFSVLAGNHVGDGRELGTTSMVVREGWFSYSDLRPQ